MQDKPFLPSVRDIIFGINRAGAGKIHNQIASDNYPGKFIGTLQDIADFTIKDGFSFIFGA